MKVLKRIRNRQMLLLLSIHCIWSIACVTCSIFISAYLFKLSGELQTVALYNLSFFLLIPISSTLIGKACKGGKYKTYFRAALTLQFIYFGSLYTCGESAPEHVLSLGALQGLAMGCYCLPFTQLIVEMKSARDRIVFMSMEKVVSRVAAITTPLVVGSAIWFTESHTPTFVVLGVLFLLMAALSKALQETTEGKAVQDFYSPAVVLQAASRDPKLRRLFGAMCLAGMSMFGPMDMLIILAIFQSVSTELHLGIVASFLPVIGIAVTIAMTRVHTSRYGNTIMAAALMLMLSTALAAAGQSWWLLCAALVLYRICLPALDLIFHSYCYNIVDDYPLLESHRTEYLVLKEQALAVGRGIGFAAVLILNAAFSSPVIWSFMLLGLSAGVVAMALCLRPVRLLAADAS